MHNGNTLWRDTSQIGDVATCPAEFTQTGLGECHSPPFLTVTVFKMCPEVRERDDSTAV